MATPVKNKILIWLDPSNDFSTKVNKEYINQFKSIVEIVETFNSIDQCMEYLKTTKKDDQLCLIIADCFIEKIKSIEMEYEQIHSVYIICNQRTKFDENKSKFKKGKGLFVDMRSLYYALKGNIRQLSNDTTTMSSTKPNVEQLEPSFMYVQLLKENLDHFVSTEMNSVKEMVNFVRSNGTIEFKEEDIEDFENTYESTKSIWWYTRETFLYRLINGALRDLDVRAIVNMGFYIRDLCVQIQKRKEKIASFQTEIDNYKNKIRKCEETMKNSDIQLRKYSNDSKRSSKSIRDIRWKIQNGIREIEQIYQEVNDLRDQIDDRRNSVTKERENFKEINEDDNDHEQYLQCQKEQKYLKIKIDNCSEVLSSIQVPSRLYRGQKMLNDQFEKLKLSRNGLVSFNCFLSITTNLEAAKIFAKPHVDSTDGKAIIFDIELNPTESLCSFAPVRSISDIPTEDEILFSVSTVFRIGEIKEDAEKIHYIKLTLTDDRDRLLKRLKDHMNISLGNRNSQYRLALLMIKMAKYDIALELYQGLLQKTENGNKEDESFIYNQIGYIYKQKNDLIHACENYNKSVEISLQFMSDTDPRLSSTYSNIGGIRKKIGDLEGALKIYQTILKIDQSLPEPNQIDISIDYNNIGSVLDEQGNYADALKYYQESVDIKLSHLPSNHPSLANTYSNIGLVHKKLGDQLTAVTFYTKALQIQEKSLDKDHPALITTYEKLARAYKELNKFTEAVENANKCLRIAEKNYGLDAPETKKRKEFLNEIMKQN